MQQHQLNPSERASLEEALKILGKTKVITAEQWAKAWGQESPGDVPIRYTAERLQQAAQENKGDQADWCLVYLGGFSLVRQHELRGASHKDMTKFDADITWWLNEEKQYWQNIGQSKYWAELGFEPSYHLVNVKGLFGNKKWQQQEDAIAELGNDKARCFEEVLSETIITIGLVTGEKICRDWVHWGRSIDCNGYRVYVNLCFDGVGVRRNLADNFDPHFRVALFWKFNAQSS